MKPLAPLTIAALTCLFAAPGCKKSEAATGLPPASGSDAPAISIPASVDAQPEASSAGGLRATGSTYAIEEAELGPKSSGVLANVYVDEGDKIRKGQRLFSLDATQAALMVKQAKASVQAAEVGKARAQLDFDRTKPLYERGAVPPATFDQVRLGLDQATVAVLQANVALSTAKQSLADASITSPLRGVVAHRYKDPGETVTMMPPTTVLVVQDLSKIEVRVNVPESAIGSVKAGDSMQVTFRALNEKAKFPIARINPSIDSRARTFEVVAIVDNADGKYKPGMLVECTFPEAPSAAGEAAPTKAAPGALMPTSSAPKTAAEPATATVSKASETAKAP